jgi:hypothetical protein
VLKWLTMKSAAVATTTRHRLRLAFFAFLATFAASRLLVFLIMARRLPDLFVHVAARTPPFSMRSASRSPSMSSVCGCTSAAATGTALKRAAAMYATEPTGCLAAPKVLAPGTQQCLH